jgi:DNA polymerase-1
MSLTYDKIIIDGNNFLFRAFFVNRPPKIIDGLNVTPIHQFLGMLKSVVSTYGGEVIMTWDRKLNSTKKNFRKELVAYKEQRVETEETTKLFSIIEHVQSVVKMMGIKTVLPVNMEADDVIRYLTKTHSGRILIVSSDQDLLQLINQNVHVYLPSKDLVVTPDNFEATTTIENPKLFLIYKSILGDKSDNIGGLVKYGKVKSKSLAEKIFKKGALDFIDSGLQPEQISLIERNLNVMDLSKTEEVYPDEYEFYRSQDENFNETFDGEELRNVFRKYEMFHYLNNFSEWNRLFNKNKDSNDLLSFISM